MRLRDENELLKLRLIWAVYTNVIVTTKKPSRTYNTPRYMYEMQSYF